MGEAKRIVKEQLKKATDYLYGEIYRIKAEQKTLQAEIDRKQKVIDEKIEAIEKLEEITDDFD